MKRTPLKRVSPSKRKAHDTFYKVTQPTWLAMYPTCQFDLHLLYPQLPEGTQCHSRNGCKVHHKMGRGKYLNDLRYFHTDCIEHHAYIEDHKKWARSVGLILYK